MKRETDPSNLPGVYRETFEEGELREAIADYLSKKRERKIYPESIIGFYIFSYPDGELETDQFSVVLGP